MKDEEEVKKGGEAQRKDKHRSKILIIEKKYITICPKKSSLTSHLVSFTIWDVCISQVALIFIRLYIAVDFLSGVWSLSVQFGSFWCKTIFYVTEF